MPINREKRTPASSRRAEKLDSQKINKNNKQAVRPRTPMADSSELQRLREENEMLRRELDAHKTKSAMADADAALYELSASDTRARKAAHAKGETSIPRLNFLGNSNRPVETRRAKRGAKKGSAPREGSRADLAIKLRQKRQGLAPVAPAKKSYRSWP